MSWTTVVPSCAKMLKLICWGGENSFPVDTLAKHTCLWLSPGSAASCAGLCEAEYQTLQGYLGSYEWPLLTWEGYAKRLPTAWTNLRPWQPEELPWKLLPGFHQRASQTIAGTEISSWSHVMMSSELDKKSCQWNMCISRTSPIWPSFGEEAVVLLITGTSVKLF